MSTGLARILNFIDNVCENYEMNELKEGEDQSENIQGIRNIRRFLNIRNINRDYDNNRFILSNIFNQNNNRQENPIANIVGSVITNYINSSVNNNDDNHNNNNNDDNHNNNDNDDNNDNHNNNDNNDNEDNKLSICLYSDLEENKKDDNCSICFEKLSDDILGITKCNHIYHHKCISEWIINNKSCPLCRKTI